jgi:hypothetical protein
VIGHIRSDRASRHAVEFRGLRRLHQAHAALCPDLLQSIGAVASGSGEHDGNRPFVLIRGKRLEQHIDRMAVTAGVRRFGHLQPAVAHLQLSIGRDHIDVVAINLHSVLDLRDRHRRAGGQNVRHLAFAIRIEMQNDHERATAIARHGFEEAAERLDAPR